METADIASDFSQVTNYIRALWRFFFQGSETKILVNESNMNNMVVSILIQLYSVTEFMHESVIICGVQM